MLLPGRLKKGLREIMYLLPDKTYLRIIYFLTFGKILSLDNPQTFNEKIQRLKLNQKEEIYSNLADKFAVRAFVASKISESILIPLYRHGNTPTDIPFDDLPDSFVIKCNHGSGYNILVRDKKTAKQGEIIQQVTKRLGEDYGKRSRELQYNGIKKQIIIEQLLLDEKGQLPVDYKLYCFSGKVLYICVVSGRHVDQSINYFDLERKEQPYSLQVSKKKYHIEKPSCFDQMKKYAETLSSGFTFMRVDFYQINGKVFFGEITLTPSSGYIQFKGDHHTIDRYLGTLMKLPQAQF